MNCPKCGVEAVIMGTAVEVRGDESPATQTEVFEVLKYQCRNPQCPNFEQEVGTVRIKTYPREEVRDDEQGKKQ